MKMFDSVVMACEQTTLDVAMAIRSSLELFRLNVYLHFCVQKKNVVDFLSGRIPESEYVILCCGGHDGGEPGTVAPVEERMSVSFRVVELVEGRWQGLRFSLTPENITQYVKLRGRTVICNGCNTGQMPLAEAFLQAGCKAYIAPTRPVDQDSTALFTIGFFYHLLCNERDKSVHCSEEEAVRLAASFDLQCKEGTESFRYYGKNMTDG